MEEQSHARFSSLGNPSLYLPLPFPVTLFPYSPVLLLSDRGSLLHGLFNCANHVEGLLGQVVVFAFDDLAEALDGVFELDVFAFQTRELRRHEEWLREEALHVARARKDQLVFV